MGIDDYKDLSIKDLRQLSKEELVGILLDIYMELGHVRQVFKEKIEKAYIGDKK